MFALTVGLICMVVGYYLGTKETDKKWFEKQKAHTDSIKGPK
jgi:hypothetical protein